MSAREDGGPAFPIPVSEGGVDCDGEIYFPGMSLRDYFAATVDISEQIEKGITVAEAKNIGIPMPEAANIGQWIKWRARWKAFLRFAEADAMLAERAK